MGDPVDYALGLLSLWFMYTVFLGVSAVSRMSCREFLERYRGFPVGSVVIVLVFSVIGVLTDVVGGSWSALSISSVVAVDVSLVGYVLFLRRVKRLCGGG